MRERENTLYRETEGKRMSDKERAVNQERERERERTHYIERQKEKE